MISNISRKASNESHFNVEHSFDAKQPFSGSERTKNIHVMHSDSKICNIFYNISLIMYFSCKKSDPLEKILKCSHRLIDIYDKLARISNIALINLSSTLKEAVEIFESVRFFGVAHLLLTPQKNKKYFLLDPYHTIQKKCDRTLLLGHTTCKTVRTLNKWKLIDLGNFSKIKIGGHLTLFHLITDGLMMGSSAFGIWDATYKLKEIYVNKTNIESKIDKWKNRAHNIAQILNEDQIEIEKFRIRYMKKNSDLQNKIDKNLEIIKSQRGTKNLNMSDFDSNLHQRMEKKIHRNEKRLQQLVSKDFDTFAKESEQKNTFLKVNKWKKLLKKNNKSKNINYLKVVSSATKIFTIAMAMGLTAVNVWSSLPFVTLLTLGVVSDTLGYFKLFIERNIKLKQIFDFNPSFHHKQISLQTKSSILTQ